jgi:hypothetical protein
MSDHDQALELNFRTRAILRAVASGRVQMVTSREPDIFVDGLACSDQASAHRLFHADLIRPTRPGRVGERVPAALTRAGESIVTAHSSPTSTAA